MLKLENGFSEYLGSKIKEDIGKELADLEKQRQHYDRYVKKLNNNSLTESEIISLKNDMQKELKARNSQLKKNTPKSNVFLG